MMKIEQGHIWAQQGQIWAQQGQMQILKDIPVAGGATGRMWQRPRRWRGQMAVGAQQWRPKPQD